jgi:hypothetical protein
MYGNSLAIAPKPSHSLRKGSPKLLPLTTSPRSAISVLGSVVSDDMYGLDGQQFCILLLHHVQGLVGNLHVITADRLIQTAIQTASMRPPIAQPMYIPSIVSLIIPFGFFLGVIVILVAPVTAVFDLYSRSIADVPGSVVNAALMLAAIAFVGIFSTLNGTSTLLVVAAAVACARRRCLLSLLRTAACFCCSCCGASVSTCINTNDAAGTPAVVAITAFTAISKAVSLYCASVRSVIVAVNDSVNALTDAVVGADVDVIGAGVGVVVGTTGL